MGVVARDIFSPLPRLLLRLLALRMDALAEFTFEEADMSRYELTWISFGGRVGGAGWAGRSMGSCMSM